MKGWFNLVHSCPYDHNSHEKSEVHLLSNHDLCHLEDPAIGIFGCQGRLALGIPPDPEASPHPHWKALVFIVVTGAIIAYFVTPFNQVRAKRPTCTYYSQPHFSTSLRGWVSHQTQL